ncbi:MAG: hypothetical protein CMB76_00335 [Euryarchaeota archaeon]|nr:hypothetical protein [Euryarchaeota archaeon]
MKTSTASDCLIIRPAKQKVMAAGRMSRRCRKFMRQIHKATTRYGLQEIASTIQSDLDRRYLSYEEALNLGNILQDRADTLPGDEIVYAVSDRDSYRRTLELYLKDGVLTQAEQLLLWEERRRLGIGDIVHNQLMEQLLTVWTRQGKSVQIHAFRGGMTDVQS